jgi:hypothetical protein
MSREEQVLTDTTKSLLQRSIGDRNPLPTTSTLLSPTAQDGACFTDEYMLNYYKVSVVSSFEATWPSWRLLSLDLTFEVSL